ncbi:MAG: hypothetical protein ACW96X_10580 [Promethearchaeota archaeon]|jgi:hypothetical protein
MAHVSEKRSVKMNCVDVEQVNLEMRLEQTINSELTKSKQLERKPVKNRLSKLFKKAELNAKYYEQTIPIHHLERQRVYRDYGLR